LFMTRLRRKAQPNDVAPLRGIRRHYQISSPRAESPNPARFRLDASTSESSALSDALERLAGRITNDPSDKESTTAVPSLTWVSSANAFGIRSAKLFPQRWIVVFIWRIYFGYPRSSSQIGQANVEIIRDDEGAVRASHETCLRTAPDTMIGSALFYLR